MVSQSMSRYLFLMTMSFFISFLRRVSSPSVSAASLSALSVAASSVGWSCRFLSWS